MDNKDNIQVHQFQLKRKDMYVYKMFMKKILNILLIVKSPENKRKSTKLKTVSVGDDTKRGLDGSSSLTGLGHLPS